MSSNCCAPLQGHRDRLKCMEGCLFCNLSGATPICIKIQNHRGLAAPFQYDWSSSIYGNSNEDRPPDQIVPRGKSMRTSTYQDASLYHDLVTGRSMSGIINFVNPTPVISLCKNQLAVETATYGSEFMVAHEPSHQIIQFHYTRCMMGIPLDRPSWMFGNSACLITYSALPHSTCNKCHNNLSYHCFTNEFRLRYFTYFTLYLLRVEGKFNLTDMLTKPVGLIRLWPLLQPLNFLK
jgi:hypothetical protein